MQRTVTKSLSFVRDRGFQRAVMASFDGRSIRNLILHALPAREKILVFSKLEFVQLPTQSILNEFGQTIEYAYFMNSGLVSILNVLSDGKSVEVGLTGKEGFVGVPLIVGFRTSATRALIQIAGEAFRLSAKDLTALLPDCPGLSKLLSRYSQELAVQSMQLAACNRIHVVDARLARWLLMSEDRVGTAAFPLTQESLASMLGTRRASVTVAAGILQSRGLITYRRGLVKIQNRRQLEDAACECYRTVDQQLKSWQKNSG